MNAKAATRNRPVLVWLVVAAGLLLLAGANAHLAYVAITTQPDCVAHAREGADAAAKSACRSE